MRRFLCWMMVVPVLLLTAHPARAAINKWAKLSAGPSYAVAVVATPGASTFNFVFISSAAAVLRSADGGVTWQTVLNVPALGITGDRNAPGVVWAATSAGLQKSTDYGETWTGINPGIRAWVAVNPGDSSVIYGDHLRSLDGGQTWTAMTGLPAFGAYYSNSVDAPNILTSPANPNRLVSFANRMAYISDDMGANWSKYPAMARSDVYGVGIDPVDASRYYVGYCNSVQRYYSGGTASGYTGGDEYTVLVDSLTPNQVYVIGQWGESWYSSNYGQSYTQYPSAGAAQMPGRAVFDPGTSRIYAATFSGLVAAYTRPLINCTDADNDGYFAAAGCGTPVDCNDGLATAFPFRSEICTDEVDNNCNGLVDCAEASCNCTACFNLDGDNYWTGGGGCGLVDCNDADNTIYPYAPENCADGIDNDCDLATDCDDGNCFGSAACCNAPESSFCGDGIDNDCDGKTDCADTECVGLEGCPALRETGMCADGIDNDLDGKIDCLDRDCAKDTVCARPVEVCDDLYDNDGDGKTDCADRDCAAFPGCAAAVEICTDGVDNDLDGAVDCADRDCAKNKACR